MSDRKTAHYNKLKRQYEDALAVVEGDEGYKLKQYKAKLIRDGCPHPETRDYVTSSDDGYGRWWQTKYRKCLVCGHEERLGSV